MPTDPPCHSSPRELRLRVPEEPALRSLDRISETVVQSMGMVT